MQLKYQEEIMTLSSMTGFARASGTADSYQWNWEVKSVNNKGLDIRVKFPQMLDGFDLAIKKAVSSKITRGSVFVSLTVESQVSGNELVIDEGKLQQLLQIAVKYSDSHGVSAPSLDGLLALKGVVDTTSSNLADDERKQLEVLLLKSLDTVLNDLISCRLDEGARMQVFFNEQLAKLEELTKQATSIAENRVPHFQGRFEAHVNKLLSPDNPIDPERLAQEVAILAVKADIQEELDRLSSHFEEADKLLNSKKPVGRRLDFLCQEFNREVNTLCSKSSDTELTNVGIEMKTVIDQFREQIQNIE